MNKTGDSLKKHVIRCVLIGMFAILLLRTGGADAAALALSCGQWNVVPSPNQGTTSQLNGVAAISPDDVWAVGLYHLNKTHFQALIEHWDGTQWSIVPSPVVGTSSTLTGVAAASSNDVWAVGYSVQRSGPGALIEHWDGTSWSVNNSFAGLGTLSGVTVISANDAWAVGNFLLDWDGTRWNFNTFQILATPYFNAVAGASPNDVYAVGSASINGTTQTLIMHWNGSGWGKVASPVIGPCGMLNGATALATNDVWAVGNNGKTCSQSKPVIEHWDGTKWRIIKNAPLSSTKATLTGVTAISASDVWAVGSFRPTGGAHAYQTLTEQWNGSAWSVVPSPNPGQNNTLKAVAASGSDVWAVGSADKSTLTEFYC